MAIFTTNHRPLRVQKRLLQFNNIPFAFGEVLNPSYTATFKGETQAYTNATHGGYFPSLGEYGKLQTSQFDAEIDFNFKGVECDDKVRYARYIRREFAKSGKLFATQSGNEIVWTNARVISINEIMDSPTQVDVIRFNVSFELIDGYWRVANRTRAFLCEYCPNNFYEFDPAYCFDATDYLGQCDPRGTSRCIPCEIKMYQPNNAPACDWKPLCNFSAAQLSQMFGQNCSNRWFIDYSCEKEKNYFCFDAPWGKKYNLDARSSDNTTVIEYCSKTDLPTTFVRVRLAGVFSNPTIQINDDILAWDPSTDSVITPAAGGVLTAGFGPEVKLSYDRRDPDKNTVDVTRNFTRTNTPVFQLKPGYNKIIVTGNQRRESSQLYVEEIALTY